MLAALARAIHGVAATAQDPARGSLHAARGGCGRRIRCIGGLSLRPITACVILGRSAASWFTENVAMVGRSQSAAHAIGRQLLCRITHAAVAVARKRITSSYVRPWFACPCFSPSNLADSRSSNLFASARWVRELLSWWQVELARLVCGGSRGLRLRLRRQGVPAAGVVLFRRAQR